MALPGSDLEGMRLLKSYQFKQNENADQKYKENRGKNKFNIQNGFQAVFRLRLSEEGLYPKSVR
jgi:hypothetical protein